MNDKDKFKRLVAVKTDINNLNSAEYIEEDTNESNYLLTKKQNRIYRINLISIILKIEHIGNITNILIDDGSGNIIMRIFEDNNIIKNLQVSDSILIIGRVRTYNKEKYIYPEIIKKISSKWLKLRSIELGVNKFNNKNEDNNKDTNEIIELNEELTNQKPEDNNKEDDNVINDASLNIHIEEKENIEVKKNSSEIELIDLAENNSESDSKENIVDEEQPDIFNPSDKIIYLIKELDEGSGAMIEDIIEKSNIEGSEKIIKNMIETGEIYQNLPGKVKIL
ncbi:hypothetical protein HN385_07060 [archaeon]|jgi:RPA family protein|nr:hypothetical protein [archaeon]MBT3450982.1 hypothetical protein [archaeon]MBT6868598.1 hypothetical protein [archaeon]MBT7193130.1 hypothetical protein [archaeon]MBT7381110.1 hypothetical protein [archaeon]